MTLSNMPKVFAFNVISFLFWLDTKSVLDQFASGLYKPWLICHKKDIRLNVFNDYVQLMISHVEFYNAVMEL